MQRQRRIYKMKNIILNKILKTKIYKNNNKK